eukprot:2878192-Alexandrium_andersonii.AAC.1
MLLLGCRHQRRLFDAWGRMLLQTVHMWPATLSHLLRQSPKVWSQGRDIDRAHNKLMHLIATAGCTGPSALAARGSLVCLLEAARREFGRATRAR